MNSEFIWKVAWMALAVVAIASIFIGMIAHVYSVAHSDSLGGILSVAVMLVCVASLTILHKLRTYFYEEGACGLTLLLMLVVMAISLVTTSLLSSATAVTNLGFVAAILVCMILIIMLW